MVLFTAIFTDAFSVASLFLFLPFLFQAKGFDTAIIGSLTGVFFVGNYLGKMVCGRIVELKGVKKVFLVAELLLALTVFSLAFTGNICLLILRKRRNDKRRLCRRKIREYQGNF